MIIINTRKSIWISLFDSNSIESIQIEVFRIPKTANRIYLLYWRLRTMLKRDQTRISSNLLNTIYQNCVILPKVADCSSFRSQYYIINVLVVSQGNVFFPIVLVKYIVFFMKSSLRFIVQILFYFTHCFAS